MFSKCFSSTLKGGVRTILRTRRCRGASPGGNVISTEENDITISTKGDPPQNAICMAVWRGKPPPLGAHWDDADGTDMIHFHAIILKGSFNFGKYHMHFDLIFPFFYFFTFVTKIPLTKTNTLSQLRCWPGEKNCIHCSLNAGFFGKLNKVIISSQPKTHFFHDIVDFVI